MRSNVNEVSAIEIRSFELTNGAINKILLCYSIFYAFFIGVVAIAYEVKSSFFKLSAFLVVTAGFCLYFYVRASKPTLFLRYCSIATICLMYMVVTAASRRLEPIFVGTTILCTTAIVRSKKVSITVFVSLVLFIIAYGGAYLVVHGVSINHIVVLSGAFTTLVLMLVLMVILFRVYSVMNSEKISMVESQAESLTDWYNNTLQTSNEVSTLLNNVILELQDNQKSSESISLSTSEIEKSMLQLALSLENQGKSTSCIQDKLLGLGKLIDELDNYTSQCRNYASDCNSNTKAVRSNSENVSILAKTIETKTSELMDDVESVKKMTELIKDISSSTDLLALNAMIEASRAGEFGKGFSVVASEIKSLSDVTRGALVDIDEKLRKLCESSVAVKEGVSSVSSEVYSQFDGIDRVSKGIELVYDNLNEITAGLEGIVENSKSVVSENNGIVEQSATISAISEELLATLESISSSSSDVYDSLCHIGGSLDSLKDGLSKIAE